MCFALLLAAASFFLGQAQVFPKSVRSSGLLPIPVLLVLLTTAAAKLAWERTLDFLNKKLR